MILAKQIKDTLNLTVEDLCKNVDKHLKKPGIHFTRKRKIPLDQVINIILSMGGKSINKELLEYYCWKEDVPSCSAFVQQRNKIDSSFFEELFQAFTRKMDPKKKFQGYRLIACDGSDISIARNPNDPDTFFKDHRHEGFNLLHLNAFYDLCSNLYLDAIVQSRKKVSEYRALWQMIDRSDIRGKVLVIADRGFESYNVLAHAQEKGWKILLRAKDIHSQGIVARLHLENQGEFDQDVVITLGKSQKKELFQKYDNYRCIMKNSTFDYLENSKDIYQLPLRILRFKLSDGSYEAIITTLSREDFPVDEIKKIYHMRWGIETAYMHLKYATGLNHLHSRKREFILQEIFAKLTMYNYCEKITRSIVVEESLGKKHIYQVNISMAFHICLKYFKSEIINIQELLKKYILPIRKDRAYPRKVRRRSFIHFNYRIS